MEVANKATRVNRLIYKTQRDGKRLLFSEFYNRPHMICASLCNRGEQHD